MKEVKKYSDVKKDLELEVIEEYVIDGIHRFKLRIKGSNIIFNVSAEDLEEAVKKVIDMMKSLKLIQ
jgi:uncharacterized protein YpuA (DUF1002 family)